MVLRLLLPALDEVQAQVLLDTANSSLKSQKPQVPAMIVTPLFGALDGSAHLEA